MHLIYETEEEAIKRADKQGEYSTLSHWVEGIGTRWLTEPAPTADGKWVLDASDYDLDDVEELALVDSYLAVEEEGGPE